MSTQETPPGQGAREGNLEAPTRHPIDWKNADYYDTDKLDAELERVFDICHGCRRCHNLCNAFPRLFDLVDESETMEVDGVAREDFAKVVDDCYLCDMCYMSKCPYVPPHPFNVDFPHLMLQAKAVRHRREGMRFRDRLLSGTDRMGRIAAIPVVAETVNAVNHWQPARTLTEKVLGVHRDAWLPPFAGKTLRRRVRPGGVGRPGEVVNVQDGQRTPGKVALFGTCYVNYNEPGIGEDLVAILEHNRIPWVMAEREVCCGMPKLEQGDLEGVERLMRFNIPRLVKLAKEGFAIMAPVPSCTLMFKQEIPLMFPDDPEVQAVSEAFWDPFGYLVARMKDGLLDTGFIRGLGTVAYQVPCHGRVQNIGRKTEEFLKLIPDTEIRTTERCSGHAGTYGVKQEHHETAMRIGRPVFRAMHEADPDYISSDCPLGGHHIAQGIRQGYDREPELAHPLSLVARAYGL